MDKDIEGTDVAVGAVSSEGERRSSTLSMARDERPAAPLAPGQRWSLARKRDAAADAGRAGRRLVPPTRGAGVAAGGVGGAGSPGSTPGCASVTTTANSARRIAASAS